MARSRPASLLLAAPCGSPRVRAQLRHNGLGGLEKDRPGASMARQGLQGRVHKPRRGLTRADAHAVELPDLLRTGFHRRGG